jgi:ATP-dependent helicase/nuclease subunit A
VTESPRSVAIAAQGAASDPLFSAFVSASAGSGKTKLLTDRVLRLLLAGEEPTRIHCLTYTRAAAAEMAQRLHSRLGAWVTQPEDVLARELGALTGEPVAPGAPLLETARGLFARVLDLPGGMRIGTIHAFCESLLRRFPVEAALSPRFRLLEETDAALAWREAREEMLQEAHTEARRAALQLVAVFATTRRFDSLVQALQEDRERLEALFALPEAALEGALRRALGVNGDEKAVCAAAVAATGRHPSPLPAALRTVAERGAPTAAGKAQALLAWLTVPPAERTWDVWRAVFLRDDGTPRGGSTLVNAKLAAQQPEVAAVLAAEQERVAAVEDARRAVRVAAVSAALLELARPLVQAWAAAKARTDRLDYEDLILCTRRLLVDPGAAWVLYKLDGGIDHLLLDEAQDTAPAQWEIVDKLAEEFFAGAGARARRRTLFAVGDRKQSIYSFQGADPGGFERWRAALRGRAASGWRDVEVPVSFRSTTPVLELVDAVFASPEAAPGVAVPGALHHLADRAGDAGSVELWPLTPHTEAAAAAKAAEATAWEVPERNLGLKAAPQRLAEALAKWIRQQTAGGVPLASRGRMLRPGDVLVLVRRRSAFAHALVRALKAHGVPVAGLDRMMLTEQPAVADLLALADTLLLPEDDLQLAAVLTSPLGGLTDASLMDLALGRPGTLWQALVRRAGERAEWQAAHAFLSRLFARVDYVTPHALLVEALGRLGGRARLLARLGAEAAEPIGELLNKALAYTRSYPPSLQGFVAWLRQSGAEVKREAGGGGDAVRVMTVHGAKGLQAPLVVLPDTTGLPPDEERVLWLRDPEAGGRLPVWAPRKEMCPGSVAALHDAARAAQMEEFHRLLYVALTRAEDRLLVCGWQPSRGLPSASWYALIEAGFRKLAAERLQGAPPWEGEALCYACPQTRPAQAAPSRAETVAEPLPRWLGQAPDWRAAPPPAETEPPRPLVPSRPEGIDLGPVPQVLSPLAGLASRFSPLRRGRLVHALLQHLPDVPVAERRQAALAWLRQPGNAPADAEMLADEVLAVLSHPTLAPLFGPEGRAEVPLGGRLGDTVVGGMVDRLAVLPDRVLLVDYKTNRTPPARVDDVPELYLRQMAAYRAVLRKALPDRQVVCALVWTVAARVMLLPDALLAHHGADLA